MTQDNTPHIGSFMAILVFTVARRLDSNDFCRDLQKSGELLLPKMPTLSDDEREKVQSMIEHFGRDVADTTLANARVLSELHPEIPWVEFLTGDAFDASS